MLQVPLYHVSTSGFSLHGITAHWTFAGTVDQFLNVHTHMTYKDKVVVESSERRGPQQLVSMARGRITTCYLRIISLCFRGCKNTYSSTNVIQHWTCFYTVSLFPKVYLILTAVNNTKPHYQVEAFRLHQSRLTASFYLFSYFQADLFASVLMTYLESVSHPESKNTAIETVNNKVSEAPLSRPLPQLQLLTVLIS